MNSSGKRHRPSHDAEAGSEDPIYAATRLPTNRITTLLQSDPEWSNFPSNAAHRFAEQVERECLRQYQHRHLHTEPLGTLWQHSETGRTPVVLIGDPQPAEHPGARWHRVGFVYLASADQAAGVARMRHEIHILKRCLAAAQMAAVDLAKKLEAVMQQNGGTETPR